MTSTPTDDLGAALVAALGRHWRADAARRIGVSIQAAWKWNSERLPAHVRAELLKMLAERNIHVSRVRDLLT